MARAPSIILTPTQKKEATVNAKVEASKAKAALAELNKARKALVDGHAKAIKDATKAAETASKAHLAKLKEQDKLIATAQKAATTADQKLLALVPPKAVPSPTAAE
jgi:hypothetical protein